MLTNEERIQIKESVEKELRDLAANIKQLESATQPISPDNAIGRLTRMEAIGSKAISEAALDKATQRKIKLEQVLDNLQKPDFGQCTKCQNPIPLPRLIYLPESNLCVSCAR